MLSEPREAQSRISTYRLTPGQPARIDLTTTNQGAPTPLETKGVYDLQGDVLTYCIGAPNQPRPTGFITKEGDKRTLAVLQRVTGERLR